MLPNEPKMSSAIGAKPDSTGSADEETPLIAQPGDGDIETGADNNNDNKSSALARHDDDDDYGESAEMTPTQSPYASKEDVGGFTIPLQFSLRLYILIFCLIFIFVELDWPPRIMRNLPTNNWLMRGWIYSFLGLVGMEEAFAVLVSDSSTNNILGSDLISIFIQLASWGMVLIGILYFALGILCMRSLKEKVRKDYYAAKDRHRR